MIEKYNFCRAFVNADFGGELMCFIELDIQDIEDVKIAETLCNFDKEEDDDGLKHYKDGWLIEVNTDEDATHTMGGYNLYFVNDDGWQFIRELTVEDGDGKFIAELEEYLLNELDYENCKKRKEGLKNAI